MEIIERGRRPDEKVWRGRCNVCHSLVEAIGSEIIVAHDPQSREDYGRANCPVCKAAMTFKEKE